MAIVEVNGCPLCHSMAGTRLRRLSPSLKTFSLFTGSKHYFLHIDRVLIENASEFDEKLTEMLLLLGIDFLMHLFSLHLCTRLLLVVSLQ